MDYSNTKHSHILILEPKSTVDKYPFSFKEIIDFFYRNPDFLINPDITPGFINKTKLVLSNNFIPAKKDLYQGDFTLPVPSNKEIDDKWSLKDFMISCYESDLDNCLSASSMISVTKDALRIDQMKNINVIGQHSLNREEFVDAFLALKEGEISDLNISIGIFSNKNVEGCSKVKPIDIRLKYKVKRTGWELKNDWTTWGPSYTVKHVSHSVKEEHYSGNIIRLVLDRIDNLSIGDCIKIKKIKKDKKCEKKIIVNMRTNSNIINIRNEYFEKDLKQDMLIRGDGIPENTYIKSIDKRQDPIIVILSKPCYKTAHNVKVIYEEYTKELNSHIVEVDKDYIIVKTQHPLELFTEGMDILKVLGKKVKVKKFVRMPKKNEKINIVSDQKFERVLNKNEKIKKVLTKEEEESAFNKLVKEALEDMKNIKTITKKDIIEEAYDLKPDDAEYRDPKVIEHLEKITGEKGSVVYSVNGFNTPRLNIHEDQEYVLEQVGNILEKAYPNQNIY